MKTGKKIFKYGTGQIVPKNAIYLKTIVQNKIEVNGKWKDCWFVWHYFLVDDENHNEGK